MSVCVIFSVLSAHLSGWDNSDKYFILSFYALKKKKQKEVGHRDEVPNSYILDPMNNCKPIPIMYIPNIQRIKEFIRKEVTMQQLYIF